MPAPNAGAVISRAARLRPDAVTLLLAAAALVGAALILAREVNYGVGTTLDSVAYISAARNAADGNGFVVLHNQSPFVNYPPLFPGLLALADLLGLDPLAAAGYLNAAAFGLAVFIASLWLRRRVRSKFLIAWTTVALVVAPPLVYTAALAAAEALFIPLTLAALLLLIAYFNGKPKRSLLILSATFTGLALLTRWSGAPLALTGVLLLLFQRDAARRQRAVNILLYMTIALTPTCLWLARNLLRIGKLSNHGDIPPGFSLMENLSTLLQRLTEASSGWSWLGRAAYSRLIDADIGTTAAFVVGVPTALFVLLKVKPNLRWRPSRSDPEFVLILFVLVYVGFVVATISYRGVVESFSIRFYAPVHIPILLLTALLLERFRAAQRNWRTAEGSDGRLMATLLRNLIAIAGAGALVLWLLPQANLYAERFRLHLNQGLGVTSQSWRESEVIRYLKANPPQGEYDLASNIRGQLYLLVGLPATHHGIPCQAEELRGFAQWMRSDGKDLYIIWSDRSGSCVTPDEIRDTLNVETAADLADGTVLIARKSG